MYERILFTIFYYYMQFRYQTFYLLTAQTLRHFSSWYFISPTQSFSYRNNPYIFSKHPLFPCKSFHLLLLCTLYLTRIMSGKTVFLDFSIDQETFLLEVCLYLYMIYVLSSQCLLFSMKSLETRRKSINRNIINSRGFKVISVTQFIIEVMFNVFVPIL